MKYNGNFRNNNTPQNYRNNHLNRNGSLQNARFDNHSETDNYSRAEERDFRTYNATPEDAIALATGAGFTARFGKQTIGYYSSKRQALYEAGKMDGKAYQITKENNRIILTPVDDNEDLSPTPAEMIADKIRSKIDVGDAPLSPLAKQRVVMLLFNSCQDKQIAFESFQILYPISNKEQFNRLWASLSDSPQPKKPNTTDSYLDYAEARGFKEIAEAILRADANSCKNLCSASDISPKQFDELYNYAVQNGCILNNSAFVSDIIKHITRENLEKRIDGDILRMIKNEPFLKKMAMSGNEDGITDYLMSSGYSKRESEEICSEIISISRLIID